MKRRTNDWISSYMQYVDNSEPPELYKVWTAVSTIAACLKRKCRLEWGRLTFYPNMYIVLVGPSGKCRKGTAMDIQWKFLERLGIKMAAESITREALIQELAESGYDELDGVKSPKLHASLTILSKELTVFLGWNNTTLMMDLTDWYDCSDRWKYRTKTQGEDDIVGVWVNLIGATTPDLIRSALPMDAVGGGLTSRIIFVYEDQKHKTVIYPEITKEEKKLGEDLSIDLQIINMMTGRFQVGEGFFDQWSDWYPKQEGKKPFEDERFAGYFERRPTHLLKLSMIMSASRSDEKIITEIDFDRALKLLELTERKMRKTFGGLGESRTAAITEKVMNVVGATKRIDRGELGQMFVNDADKEVLDKIIETLESINFCQYVYVDSKNSYVELIEKETKNEREKTLGEIEREWQTIRARSNKGSEGTGSGGDKEGS